MCLIAFDWKPDATPSLILAANRDEFYDRPSQPAGYWDDKPDIYGGRDLLLGGSWLCCSTSGRCAAITNFFSRGDEGIQYPKSRGEVITTFVRSRLSSDEFVRLELEDHRDEYGGFSAILFDGESLMYCTNRDGANFARKLLTGVYGLSNHLLDTSWPKVEKLKHAVAHARSLRDDPQQLATELFKALEDREAVNDESLLPTILSQEEELQRSAIFVEAPKFGTRTSTVLTFTPREGFFFSEKNHGTRLSAFTSFSQTFVAQKDSSQ